ncbi:type I-E CRISPR-associated protein Cas6/Cse3/CasE [Promicromonospora sp. NFX87]|uniref:type I-E CRISPR-associated protein Cas6/Cse3/CasE n=1 Tax=Promicromonospora sp. NFX87 TaxID=3402691 RepID=UPI003AFA5483
MYLTRCEINPVARGARKLLGSPQAMHAAVLAGFHAGSGDVGRVLWRVDQDRKHTWLYLVSAAEPDLTHLIDQAGWPATQTWDTRDYGRTLARLEAGQRWAFRLRANPTSNVRDGSGGRGKRVAHVTVAQQMDWFVRRAPSFGIDVGKDEEPTVVLAGRGVDEFRRRSDSSARGGASGRTPSWGQVTVAWAQFDGTLTVVDPDALRAVLTGGVGSAKAYGCGLLTLARSVTP